MRKEKWKKVSKRKSKEKVLERIRRKKKGELLRPIGNEEERHCHGTKVKDVKVRGT